MEYFLLKKRELILRKTFIAISMWDRQSKNRL